MQVKRKSVISGIVRTRDIAVHHKDLESWEKGFGSITDCMPYLNDEDRTFILAGITNSEWKQVFQDEINNIVNDRF